MDLLSLLNENARLTNAQLAVMLGKTEEEVEKEILTVISEDVQIKDPHNLRTRRIGNDFA